MTTPTEDTPRFVDLETWKQAKAPAGARVAKFGTFSIETRAGEDPAKAKTTILRITSERVDRQNDTIKLDGWHLDAYRDNPVVLWAHDGRLPPVGNSLREWKEGGFLKIEVEWVERELNEFAWMIGEYVKRNKMRANSVGFRPIKYAWNEERGGYAIDFVEQELLEDSIVPIPANPDALVDEAKALDLPIHTLAEWAERSIEAVRGKGFWMTAKGLEEALLKTWSASTTRPIVSLPPAPAPAAKSSIVTDIPDDMLGDHVARLVRGELSTITGRK
jgi:HK97 family phage prohead protease